ncbi:S46 family peptidase [Coralloluteibacterium thermophilus]|uniref:Dipeptidyl-peptidase n=1 Tax=Coralloluteibacterium thermophilum TaxID=2707049 RepID=A0ABV9NTF5_9GAMM
MTLRFHPLAAALVAGLVFLPARAGAVEGMWVPQQLPEIAGPLREAGLTLPPEQLTDLTAHPMAAVVSLGGCTASFVSPEGLVVTNHHCAYGSLQLNSTPERDLTTEGFDAPTLADEISGGPNARIYVTESITDVTDQVRAAQADARDGAARQAATEALQKRMVAECEQGGGYRCTVYAFFGGLEYRLFRQMEIKDVRVVYAPPAGIGAYGGDIDNWMWPRHTGDFTFLRAYVDKDGRPVPYAEDNVPYRPKHWLRIGEEGLEAGDFAMVAGYPGRTFRYALADEFEHTQGWTYPAGIESYRAQLDIIEAAGRADRDVEIKYAAQVKGLNNYLKNMTGQLEGFEKADAMAAKRRDEAAVLDWLRGQGRQGRPALQAYERLRAAHAAERATRERDLVVNGVLNTGLISTANRLVRASIEKAKPDAERASGYQVRDAAAFRGNLEQMDRRYDAGVDRQLLAYWLGRYVQLPADQRVPAIDAWLGGNDAAAVERALDGLYAGTRLGDRAIRLGWIDADFERIQTSGDAALRLAVALSPYLLEREAQAKAASGEDMRDRPLFLQAVIDYNRSEGRAVYPDANSSLRITFGNVTGYSPAPGVVHQPFTRLEEIADKHTGQDPFDAGQAQLDAIAAGRHGNRASAAQGTVPVNFLTDLDVTGGNSGSPTLNANGELVGLVFDMNWESVASNWVFNPELTRTIHVDIRYLLWVMEQVQPAPRLLEEMGVRGSEE